MKSEDFSSKSVKIAGAKKSSAYRVWEGCTAALLFQLSLELTGKSRVNIPVVHYMTGSTVRFDNSPI